MTGQTSIKVVILGAGYGTRLQRDIQNDSTGSFHHLLGVPKALLPLAPHDALITHWLHTFSSANHPFDPAQDLYVVSNAHFYKNFLAWAEKHSIPSDHIANDGTQSNETRLGAVPDMHFAVDTFKLHDANVLFVGGDTLFLKDFSFDTFVQHFDQANPGDEPNVSLVTAYTVRDTFVHKFGIMELNNEGYISGFREKPQPSETESRLACPCFYLFTPPAVKSLATFLDECHQAGKGLEEFDATGKFLAWLVKRQPVTVMPVSGRIDVGGLESYVDAVKYFE